MKLILDNSEAAIQADGGNIIWRAGKYNTYKLSQSDIVYVGGPSYLNHEISIIEGSIESKNFSIAVRNNNSDMNTSINIENDIIISIISLSMTMKFSGYKWKVNSGTEEHIFEISQEDID